MTADTTYTLSSFGTMQFMFMLLAESANASTQPKDFIAPVGALCGVAIAAFVAWFNARKTPPDRLQTLINIYRDWPDGLTGKQRVGRLIALEVAEMRHKQPKNQQEYDPEATVGEADFTDAAKAYRHRDALGFVLSVVVLVGLGLFWLFHRPPDNQWVIVVSLVAGFAVFFAVTRGLGVVRRWM